MVFKEEWFDKVQDFFKKDWPIIGIAILSFVVAGFVGLGGTVGGAVAYKGATADEGSLPKRLFATFLGGIIGIVATLALSKIGDLIGSIGRIIGSIAGVVIALLGGIRIADVLTEKNVTLSEDVVSKIDKSSPKEKSKRGNKNRAKKRMVRRRMSRAKK
ncbi:MAG: hypothetical protein HRU36_00560 [Rickettsiales bacterium]|nr:hypothetical protein [Rickettsiales bacterium]